MQREGFILYYSFWEAISELPDTNQLELYKAITEYSFNFKQIELTGISKTVWTLIKPQLDANNRRFLNGNKPKKSKTEANEKQNGSKTEAKEKEKEKEKDIKGKNLTDFLQENFTEKEKDSNTYLFLEYALKSGVQITHPLTEQFKQNLRSKMKEIREKTRWNVDRVLVELKAMVDYHVTKQNEFGNTLGRINTWFSKKY